MAYNPEESDDRYRPLNHLPPIPPYVPPRLHVKSCMTCGSWVNDKCAYEIELAWKQKACSCWNPKEV